MILSAICRATAFLSSSGTSFIEKTPAYFSFLSMRPWYIKKTTINMTVFSAPFMLFRVKSKGHEDIWQWINNIYR
jgi:hypothetical protein